MSVRNRTPATGPYATPAAGEAAYTENRFAAVLGVLHAYRFLWTTEDELQQGLALALERAGHPVQREVRLNARDRIDLLVDRVGIEVKTAGAWRDVERQLRRYLESDTLDELVLVTAKAMHRRIPQGDVAGKRLHVHQLEASGL